MEPDTSTPARRSVGRISPLERAFLIWHRDHGKRLCRAINIGERTTAGLTFSFEGVPALTATLNERGVDVFAFFKGEFWDGILCLEGYPRRTKGGWICSDCLPEYFKLFPTRQDLWHDHIFEPLELWINDDLIVADRISFYATKTGGITWASLSPNVHKRDVGIVPVGVALFAPLKAP
jgi:hypothetical protein